MKIISGCGSAGHDGIVEMISGVTSQINLLALNAPIASEIDALNIISSRVVDDWSSLCSLAGKRLHNQCVYA
ncbi:hypothetical protein [Bradyrhizobium sp. LB11.1]|uniref:hypothetical protein n=1 Tax=Bradyrhizobium sp. LB11.1 TaxID=3156326 RepID=UPI003392D8F5